MSFVHHSFVSVPNLIFIGVTDFDANQKMLHKKSFPGAVK